MAISEYSRISMDKNQNIVYLTGIRTDAVNANYIARIDI